jgi:RHS repeat-associated protein
VADPQTDVQPSGTVEYPDTVTDTVWRDIMNSPGTVDEEKGQQFTVLGTAMNTGREFADYSAYLQDPNNRQGLEDLLVAELGPTGDDYRQIIHETLDALAHSDVGYLPDPWQLNVGEGADPVLLATGEFVLVAEDLRVNGAGLDFVFRRTYRNQTVYIGPLGANWDHCYDIRLRETGGDLVLAGGDLREQRYTLHPDHGYFVPPDGVDAVIEPAGNSYVRRAVDGLRHMFDADPATGGQHRLVRIQDRFGRYLDLRYSEEEGGRLARVDVNHPARSVTFGYDELGRITAVTDHTGRTWRYAYDDSGDLVAVTTPATEARPGGLTTSYEYSTELGGTLLHNLRSVTDPSGRLFLENDYGETAGQPEYNRVVRQRQAGGDTLFDYEDVDPVFEHEYSDAERPTTATTVTGCDGHQVRHVFNLFGNELAREEYVHVAGQIRFLAAHYRFNRDGQLTGALSPGGVLTQYLYGRDLFLRQHDITDDDVAVHQDLTAQVRLGFGRLLATVRRARPFHLDAATAQGTWAAFPDIVGGFAEDDDDVVVKVSYEPDYSQVLTTSDARFTRSADPAAVLEHPRFAETLTRYSYDGPPGDPHRYLVEIRRPTPTLPDGTQGDPVVEQFRHPDGSPAYDASGRLLRRTDARGTVTELQYVPDDPLDPRSGYPLEIVQDPGGLAVTTTFVETDALGRVLATRLPRGAGESGDAFVERAAYDALDQLTDTTTVPPFRFRTLRAYDDTGRLVRVEHPLLDERGQPVLGGVALRTFCYDEELQLTAEAVGGADPDKRLVTRHQYDAAGLRRVTVLPEGNLIAYRYDERQLRRATIQGYGSVDEAISRLEYDDDRRLSRSIDPTGAATTYTLDTFGRVVAEENPLGHVVVRDYDKLGAETCSRWFERRGDGYVLLARSEITYDELGRPVRHGINRFEQPLGPVPRGQLAGAYRAAPGPGQLLTTLVFHDAGGLVVRAVDALDRAVTLEYDALGRLISHTEAPGDQRRNTYDAHGNVVRCDRIQTIRDAATGAVTGQRAFAEEYAFDELDRLVESRDSLGNATHYAYDSRDNQVLTVDPLGRTSRVEFDLFGRPAAVREEPASADPGSPRVTLLEHDRNGNLVAVVDPRGRRTSYGYDALDRLTRTTRPDGSAERLEYDRATRLAASTDPNGLVKRFTVDAADRTVGVDVDRSGLPPGLRVEGADAWRYEYDGLNRPTRETNDYVDRRLVHDSCGWPVRETVAITGPVPFADLTLERQFDAAGRCVGLGYPEGRRLRLDRDALDQVTRITDVALGQDYPGSATPPAGPIAVFGYAGRQIVTSIAGNGVTGDYRHDGVGRPIDVRYAAGAPLLHLQYLFDGAGAVSLGQEVTGATAAAERFVNDYSGWLVRVVPENDAPFDPGPLAPPPDALPSPLPDRQAAIDALVGAVPAAEPEVVVEYDPAGNRSQELLAGGAVVGYQADDVDEYLTRAGVALAYDAAGNLRRDGKHEYVYDADNRLVRVAESATGTDVARFYHDARGRRCVEVVGAMVTHLLWDGDDLLAEYVDGQLARQYVHDAGSGPPVQLAAGGGEFWCHADLVGSVRLLTDAGGGVAAAYQYDPFGVPRQVEEPGGTIPLRYGGYRLDASLDSYDCRARQYDPRLGRFLQRDPAGMRDGTNPYTYAGNDPMRFGDPTGMGRSEHAPAYPVRPTSPLQPDRILVGKGGVPWRYQDGTLSYAGDDGREYCFDHSTSAGAFGWRIRPEGYTGPPRSRYTNNTAAELALDGKYNLAEIAEQGQACFYCHVERTFGHTPSDEEFDLSQVSDDVLFWNDVEMTIMEALGFVEPFPEPFPVAPPRLRTPSTTLRVSRVASAGFRRTSVGRRLMRTLVEDRATFRLSKDFFKRYGRVLRNRAGAAPRWSLEHMILKQRWYRGANPLFQRGTWANKVLQGLGDAGWNLLPVPHRFNRFLYNRPLVSAAFNLGAYYAVYKGTQGTYHFGQYLHGQLFDADEPAP